MARMPTIEVRAGDMRAILRHLVEVERATVQAIVTDPPYHLQSIVDRFGAKNASPAKVGKTGAFARASAGFMGQQWDGGDIAFQPETWRLCWELLPPGGHLIAFGGTRTYHRMAVAIEDAGFEVRDMIGWLYGTGFPKSHDVAKGIDRAAGATREVKGTYKHGPAMHPGNEGIDNWRDKHTGEVAITAPATAAARLWDGWGTALKPALEPICVARKPMFATVARNMQRHRVGGLNIEACRVGLGHFPEQESTIRTSRKRMTSKGNPGGSYGNGYGLPIDQPRQSGSDAGRWPANIIHDGSPEVVAAFPVSKGQLARASTSTSTRKTQNVYGAMRRGHKGMEPRGDDGSAARFFFSAKASKDDRAGSKHPTVKRVDLLRWLVRLVTPPGGTVLDPFAGSGTTGAACFREGFNCIMVEREAEYVADIKRRMAALRRNSK